MSVENAAPAGGDDIPVAEIPAHVPGGDGPLSAREAARSLTDWRRKQEAAPAPEARQAESSQEAPPAEDSGTEPDAAPPQEAPSETQEAEPAPQEPSIDPPRSWTKEAKERWQSLPRETQEYLAIREQEREREVRRSQNEAAEQRKAFEAKQTALEQSRQQYESALPALLDAMHQSMAGDFADIKTIADVENLARNDWARYIQWDAQQKKIAAITNEVNAARERQANEATAKFNEFAKEQDKLFMERAPELADKEIAAGIQKDAVSVLRDKGFTEEEISRSWNGQEKLSLRDHRLQDLILDATRYRRDQEARAAALKKVAAKPLPPVQRPGVAQPGNPGLQGQIESIQKQLKNATGLNAIRLGTQLTGLQRQAAAKR